MLKTYIVLFVNAETGKVGHDLFTAATYSEARRDFNDCYRHATYQILAVVEKPEVRTNASKGNF